MAQAADNTENKSKGKEVMKAVIQRVPHAKCHIEGALFSEISAGYLVLLGVENGDTREDADYLAGKIANLRVLADEEGKLNRSPLQIGGELMVISQFTLSADCKKGNRPSFTDAMAPDPAKEMYEYVIEKLRTLGIARVETGVFGADMKLEFINDGPVTILMDTKVMR